LVGSKVNIRYIKVKGQNSPEGMPLAKIQKSKFKIQKKNEKSEKRVVGSE